MLCRKGKESKGKKSNIQILFSVKINQKHQKHVICDWLPTSSSIFTYEIKFSITADLYKSLSFILLHYPVKGPSAVGFLEKLKCSWHTDGFRISIILEEPLFNWRFFLTYPHHLKYHKKKKNVTKYTYSFCFKCERIPCSTIKLDKISFLKEKKIAQVFVFIWYDGIWTCQLSAGF